MSSELSSTRPLKIYLIAGEASGDFLGANLMRSLKEHSTRDIQFFGIGGPRMIAEGLVSLFPYYELSRLGFVEILPYAFNLIARIIKTSDDIQDKDPDMLVTIDCPGFCYRVAKRLRKEKHKTLYIHYVAPTVWAYKPDRAEKCAAIFDHLLTLLPFEPPLFEKAGLPATWVGHAAVVESRVGNAEAFRKKYELPDDAPLFMLMPGSRKGEVDRHMPIFAKCLTILSGMYPNLVIAVAVPENVMPFVTPYFESCPFRAILMGGDTDKKDAIAASDLAIVKSGTVTLEVAKAGTPMLVAYHVNKISAYLFKRMALIRYVTLINILLKKPIIPEFLQENCNPFMLAHAASNLLSDTGWQQRQKEGQAKALQMLTPPDGKLPSNLAAEKILELYREYSLQSEDSEASDAPE